MNHAYNRAYYLRTREARLAHGRIYYEGNREARIARQKILIAELRLQVIAGYGGQCSCCGEDNPIFLDLDHVNGGGSAARRRNRSPYAAYRIARKQGFPPEYQVLCCNCNCGRHRNGGVCPHKEIRSMAA